MKNIFNVNYQDLENYFVSINDKKFRATQVYDFLYKKRIYDVNKMSNISNNIKETLKNNFDFTFIKIKEKQEDTNVKKYLFELKDNNFIESVLMYHDYGISLCVSSQVGCNMGCKFCESGRLKKVRNLETYEMVEQVLLIEEDIKDRISHVVIMGIGEPFDNYENVSNFIKIINSNKGIAIGSRHITVSTCGLVNGIERFMNDFLEVNLAISLHAPNDKIRNQIMPINKVYNLKELMKVLKKYEKTTNRRITFEYIMLEGINDSLKNAEELAKLIKGLNCYVNLIPYNETENIEFKRTKKVQILAFYDILKKNSINVTIRKEFGTKVDAACGQLRANQMGR
ncbi:MAG: 23S rRNA (adenine(2503)-C(2))-methyltransferase RlmN [Bacilli bacterium]|nr:23S rRNA (adenine(2503)-C(2))-methyltransferase RlmN [Bacilli bacterium]